MRITEINFNDYVYIKLTDAGVRRLIDNHNKLVEDAVTTYGVVPPSLKVMLMPEPVGNGLVKMQFWHMANEFGGPTADQLFECDFQHVRIHLLPEGHAALWEFGISPPETDAMKHATWEIHDFVKTMGPLMNHADNPPFNPIVYLCHDN